MRSRREAREVRYLRRRGRCGVDISIVGHDTCTLGAHRDIGAGPSRAHGGRLAEVSSSQRHRFVEGRARVIASNERRERLRDT